MTTGKGDVQVVLAGLDRLPTDHDERLSVAVLGHDDPLADLAAIVQPHLSIGPVVVIEPSWDSRACRTVDSLHAALDDPGFLRHRTGLPPLAAAALAATAARLPHRDAAVSRLVAGLPLVESTIDTGALLGSVSHLEHLSASVGQHLASWLPGGRFLATAEPDGTGTVRRLRRKEAVPAPDVPADHRLVLAAGDTELTSGLVEALRGPAAADGDPTVHPLPSQSTAWWGTHDLVEYAIVPRDLDDLAARIDVEVGSGQDCHWCRRSTPVSPCTWCGHVAVADTVAS